MSSRAPKVSVCIPVYNGGHYIAESIASVLAQTYRDFRLIVCDNCSTDNTADVVKSFRDSRLTYVRNAYNLGMVGNANRCLSQAHGEYVCIWHHDDVMLPTNLERKVSLLDHNPGVGLVHSNMILIDREGKVLADQWNEESRRDYVEDGRTVFRRFVAHIPIGANIFIGAVLARRECYERLGGFRPQLGYTSDSEMWMRMSLFYDVACIGTPLVKYRQHAATGTSSLGMGVRFLHEHYSATKIIFDEYKEHIENWHCVQRQVKASFSARAFNEAWKAYDKGNLVASKEYMKFAAHVFPKVMGSREFWRLAARLAGGRAGSRVYHAVRRGLRGSS